MENNDSYDIDERKGKSKIFWQRLVCLLVVYCICCGTFRFVANIIEYKKQQKIKQETLVLVEEKNRKINLLTEINESFWIPGTTELEFEKGIKIPLPNTYIEDDVISCKKGFESNEIAHSSYVVKVSYEGDNSTDNILLEIFKDRLDDDYNYKQVYYYDNYGTRIFTRDENEGYFSYIIFRGLEVTYGVCYGEPKIKNY